MEQEPPSAAYPSPHVIASIVPIARLFIFFKLRVIINVLLLLYLARFHEFTRTDSAYRIEVTRCSVYRCGLRRTFLLEQNTV